LAESLDEDAIVRGLRTGDRQAWTALYDAYSERVWRYVARLLGADSAAVADVVQETFIAAARSARNFDPSRGTLWAWLTGIAHNHVSLFWKQISRQERLRALAESNGGLPEWERLAADPSVDLEQEELVDVIRAVLATLPSDYAVVLTAKYIEDLTVAEIQDLQGGTSEAVRSRLHRARAAFRDVFHSLTGEFARRTGRQPVPHAKDDQ
jgi:RNA polymerase sigma-70 factor (ECF subfamily)